ncbi:MAG: hypothetical protein GY950_32140 [bacterium]|nr:hypothetical protein [bacterium]
MKTIHQNSQDQGIDQLLKQTLRDDLPPEVENGMKRQLNLFREKMDERDEVRTSLPDRLFSLFSGFSWDDFKPARVIFSRGALAFASLLMLVVGSLMQMSGSPSVLADSISTRNAALHTFNRVIISGNSMECTVEAPGEGEKAITYSIQWLEGGGCRARAVIPGEPVEKTLWINKGEDVHRIDDPVFLPVRNLLSLSRFTGILGGKWELKQYRREGECEYGTFYITNPDDGTRVEMTADLCTWLPVSMEMSLPQRLEVHFSWSVSTSSLLIASGPDKKKLEGVRAADRR